MFMSHKEVLKTETHLSLNNVISENPMKNTEGLVTYNINQLRFMIILKTTI
jgi:hypothetical protein